ncbi:MAG: HNH endonuclease [Candidatus Micrarchaeota archaeon]|nr:HNH endonuclease [Candidatus Micrarchaeota archaeon]
MLATTSNRLFQSRLQEREGLCPKRNCSSSYEKCKRERVGRFLRKEVLEKNKNRCYCCEMKEGEKGKRLELHHIQPVSLGGKTEASNLLPLCFNCHRSVHKRIDALHMRPGKVKRSLLEDAVLQVAQLRQKEKAGKFARLEPLVEGISTHLQSHEGFCCLSDIEKVKLVIFILSFTLSRKQLKRLRREAERQG